MLSPTKHLNILVTGIIALSLITACTSTKKGESDAAQKAEVKAPVKTAEQIAAEKAKAKEEARKKAEADEDSVQTKTIKTVGSPSAEKLNGEQVSADKSSSGKAAGGDMAMMPSTSPSTMSKHKIPTEPNTYLVTVEPKTNKHPHFGVGDERGFLVNGKPGNFVVAQRGEKVTFKVRTGVQHDFYITTNAKGWGAAAYMDGVDGQFTYNGDVTVQANEKTPDTLFYGCRNHNSMGGKIAVVDKNADLMKVKNDLQQEHQSALDKLAAKKASVDPKKVKQKIAYVKMLLQFKGKTLSADQKQEITDKLNNAKSLEKKGELGAALAVADAAGLMFNQKSKAAGPSDEEIAEGKEHMKDLLVTLEAFIDSHKAMYDQTKRNNPDGVVDYDRDLVGSLVAEGKKLADKYKFDDAEKRIKRAERLVTKALNDMYGGQKTVVYDLNFETPQEEFDYEVKRYLSYEELIPVAIEVKKPKQASIKLMETYLNKGKFFKKKAEESAAAGRWEEAMVVIRDATTEVRRGLRLLGVSM